MKFSIFSINDGKRTGLVSNSSNPPSRASCLCSAIALAVKAIIGIFTVSEFSLPDYILDFKKVSSSDRLDFIESKSLQKSCL